MISIDKAGIYHDGCCGNDHILESNKSIINDISVMIWKNTQRYNNIIAELEKLRMQNDKTRKTGNEIKDLFWSLYEENNLSNRDIVLAELEGLLKELEEHKAYNSKVIEKLFSELDNCVKGYDILAPSKCLDNCLDYKNNTYLNSIIEDFSNTNIDYDESIDLACETYESLKLWIKELAQEINILAKGSENKYQDFDKEKEEYLNEINKFQAQKYKKMLEKISLSNLKLDTYMHHLSNKERIDSKEVISFLKNLKELVSIPETYPDYHEDNGEKIKKIIISLENSCEELQNINFEFYNSWKTTLIDYIKIIKDSIPQKWEKIN